jgi:hypothetical protein
MGLEETQEKIRTILQQKYGVGDVEFGTIDVHEYKDCPYVGFYLRKASDQENLDRIQGPLQKRVLSATSDGFTDRRNYVTIFVEKPHEKEDLYRRAVLVVKQPTSQKQTTVEELTEVFYDALEQGLGLIGLQRYFPSKGTFPGENAKKRTITKRGSLQRNSRNSYWRN